MVWYYYAFPIKTKIQVLLRLSSPINQMQINKLIIYQVSCL